MDKEAFFSGYCRQIDSSRTVAVEAEGASLTYADCAYDNCPYADTCPIGKSIRQFLEGQ